MFKRLLTSIERRLEEKGQGTGKVGAFRWLILLGCGGAALMILSSFFSVSPGLPLPEGSEGKEQEAVSPSWGKEDPKGIEEQEKKFEAQLSDVLSKIVGVGEVSVMVTLESTMEQVVEKDRRQSEQVTSENDKRGGTRKIDEQTRDEKVVLHRDEGGEGPIVVKQLKPRVRGVLVVAEGAENMQVKAVIVEAIQRVLDVPVHRISVLPKG